MLRRLDSRDRCDAPRVLRVDPRSPSRAAPRDHVCENTVGCASGPHARQSAATACHIVAGDSVSQCRHDHTPQSGTTHTCRFPQALGWCQLNAICVLLEQFNNTTSHTLISFSKSFYILSDLSHLGMHSSGRGWRPAPVLIRPTNCINKFGGNSRLSSMLSSAALST